MCCPEPMSHRVTPFGWLRLGHAAAGWKITQGQTLAPRTGELTPSMENGVKGAAGCNAGQEWSGHCQPPAAQDTSAGSCHRGGKGGKQG